MVTINTLLSDIEPPQRQQIILRESAIAYLVLLFFLFVGNEILAFLGVDRYTLRISGGIILFLIALSMVFPSKGAAPTMILRFDLRNVGLILLAVQMLLDGFQQYLALGE